MMAGLDLASCLACSKSICEKDVQPLCISSLTSAGVRKIFPVIANVFGLGDWRHLRLLSGIASGLVRFH
jgi:hypothetical protein